MTGSAYISRRLDIDPRELPNIASEWHHRLRSIRMAPRSVRLGNGFWLASDAEHGGVDPLMLYEVPGVVWINGRPVLVKLEFSMWSDTLSEIGVRPKGISWPVGTDRYERRVEAAFDVVSASLSLSTRHDSLWKPAPVPVSQVREPVVTRLAVGSG
jgi:hypothetical protein